MTPRITPERAQQLRDALANRTALEWPLSTGDEDDLLLLVEDYLEIRERPECQR